MAKTNQSYDNLVMQIMSEVIQPYYGESILTHATTVDEALEAFFRVDSREIYFLEVMEPFKLPGSYWSIDGKTPKSFGKRRLALFDRLLIRYDLADPDNYIVQNRIGTGIESVFLLTRAEWDGIKSKVKVVYKSELTGKDPTLARRNKSYHENFVRDHLGCGFEFKTALGYVRPQYKARNTGRKP